MATTTYGSPYVQSSDLVSGWPTSSLAVADRIDDVAMKGNGINAQTGTTYTTLLTDAGKTITTSNAAAVTVTIPTNASVAYEIGSVIQFLNIGVGALTIAASGGVTINNNLGTTAQYGAYSILKTATDTWYATPFSSGSAKATVSATTGSPTTTTVSGKTLYQFTGSGSITMTAGTFDTLMIGAGAGGGAAYGGGGGGQVLYLTGQLAAAGTYTVTVGAGSAGSSGTYASGGKSVLGSLISVGGGHGGTNAANRTTGGDGSSGGGGAVSAIGGLGLTYDGAAGRTDGATYSSGGGGAGAGAIGIYPATGGTAPSGGAGTANSITGASVTYGGGGGGGSQAGTPGAGGAGGGGAGTSTNGATATAGTANTGGGGGGGGYNGTGGAGGSGCVFILIG